MALWVFYLVALVAFAAALSLIFHPKPMVAGLSMAVCMLAVGALYILLHVPFLGFFQVIIYTGAVMVMVLYIIMALGSRETGHEVGTVQFVTTLIAAGLFLAQAGRLVWKAGDARFPDVDRSFGSIQQFGALLVERYAVPFEVASLVLLAAMVGAVILARRIWT
jgi:NADH-quinone oxidoreductase subunit J